MNGICYNDYLCQKDVFYFLISKFFIFFINGIKEMLLKYRNFKIENNIEL